MTAWDIIDHESVPGDNGFMYLVADGDKYSIHVNGYELMADGAHGSEDALADFACDRLARLDDARVLVGGLGMGFTLAAALRRIGPGGSATVAELVPAVVRWHHDYIGGVAHHPLRDPRVVVHMGDVIDLVRSPPVPWSAILLDVDNGPNALTRPHNAWLYTHAGLLEAFAALMPGCVLGIWSARADDELTRRLEETGFEVEVLWFTEDERAAGDEEGCTQVLWMARRPESQ